MAKVRKESSPFEAAPAGTHHAVCVAVIDLGTHDREKTDNHGVKRMVPTTEIWVGFELVERKADGTPFVVGRPYTLSLNEKAKLTQVCQALTGGVPAEGEEMIPQEQFPGKSCVISLKHKKEKKNDQERTYVNIDSVSPPMKGQPEFEPASPLIAWELGDPTPEGLFDDLPRIYGVKIEDVIASSQEMQDEGGGEGQELAGVGAGDDSPF